uniref:SFRICE_023772 n=1 Tax=Spodoptera frugiperda TaxID=7108 RepID=A0A2H1WXY4_SPOFR
MVNVLLIIFCVIVLGLVAFMFEHNLTNPANYRLKHFFFSPFKSSLNSRTKFAKSGQPFSSFSETNEQQLIFIYCIDYF